MDLQKHHRRTAKIGADCVACGCCVRVCPLSAIRIWNGITARVDADRCVGCGKCIKVCPYQAIKETVIRGETKAEVVETVCQGCGVCNATCPQGAIQVSHFTDNQILAEVNALCQF